MTDQLDQALDLIAGWLQEAKNVVVFTGAGMSTESGIPDFRSPGGIWSKYDPRELTYQRFLADPQVRKLRWKMFMEHTSLWEAQPNEGHKAIADLEKLGKLSGLITQNIDGLHQKAGNSAALVVELHGTNRYVVCLNCGTTWPSEQIRERILKESLEIPDCTKCGGIIKTATISFGQAMPEAEMRKAEALSRNADLFLVIGSTLVVAPANMMPIMAKHAGARVVIINLSETEGDQYADIIIRGKAGEIMPALLDRYKKKNKNSRQ